MQAFLKARVNGPGNILPRLRGENDRTAFFFCDIAQDRDNMDS